MMKSLAQVKVFEIAEKLLSLHESVLLPRNPVLSAKNLFKSGQVDWKRTKAVGFLYGQIYFNSSGHSLANYNTLREKITSAALRLKHPVTGLPIVTRIYTREELFGDQHKNNPPDLTLVISEYADNVRTDLEHRGFWEGPDHRSGDHRSEGIFIVKGPSINHGGSNEVSALALLILPLRCYSFLDYRCLETWMVVSWPRFLKPEVSQRGLNQSHYHKISEKKENLIAYIPQKIKKKRRKS